MTFNSTGTATGGTVSTMVGMNFNAVITWSAGGTIGAAGINFPINVASGINENMGSQAFSISATAAFTKNGAGALQTAGGTYAGGFTLNSGTLIAGGINAMGNGALILNSGTVAGSATRDFTAKFASGITIGGNIQFGEMSTVISLANSTANLTFSNNISLGSSLRTLTLGNGGNMTFSGIISNSASTGITFAANVNGTGTITLGSANTYSGTTTINGGEVVFPADGSFGAIPGSVTTNSIIIDGGRLTLQPSASSSYTLNANRGIQVGSTLGTSISVKTGTSVTYNGIIADKTSSTGILVKQGSAILILGTTNTYSGSTSINNGTIKIGITDALPSTTTLNIGQSLSTNLGIFDLGGFNQTIAGLNSISGTNASASKNTLTTSTGSSTLTFNGNGSYSYGDGTAANSGIITGAVSLVMNGSGTQTLGDANTFNGTVTINNGNLSIATIGNGGVASSNLGSASNAASNLVLGGGALLYTGATASSDRNFTLTTSTTSSINISTNTLTISGGSASTSGALSKIGTGTLILTGTNLHTGLTTITAGILQLNKSGGTTLLATNDVTINGGTLKVSSNQTLNNLTVSSGTLLIDAGVTLTINGTYTGGGTITNNGTLIINTANTFPGSSTTITTGFNNLTLGANTTLDANISVSGTLALGNNTLNLAGNTLTINGDFTTGTGVIKSNGSGTINIGGTGALTNSLLYDQTTPGTTNRVQYFNLNRGTSTSTGSITLGNTLEITGTLTLSNGTFNTGGTLTLISDASGTARITSIPSTADILGNVKSQRYVPAVVRQYRMISPNTASFTYSDIIDNIFVSGTGGATNGFDPTTNNGSTIYTYQEATTGTGRGWKAATAITNSLSPANGAIVYVRGDRTIASPDWYTINNSTYPSSFGFPAQNAVTLDFNGAINKGTYSPTLTYTTTSTSSNDGWNLIGNPYPSQINWGTLSLTNVDPFFYAFNTSSGSYVTYSGSEYIASGQAFFVQATGTSPSITFTENCKVSAAPTNYFKTASSPSIELKMTKDSFNSDIAFISFNVSSSKGFVRGEDAIKFSNPKINFGFYIDSNYTVQRNAVPMPSVTDTFILSAYAAAGTYTIQVTNIIAALPITKSIYLHDLFNNNFIDLRSSPTYTFTITANIATTGNRFELIILDLSTLPVKWNAFTGEKFNSNAVKLQWQTSDEKNNQHFIIQRSVNNISFEEIGLVNGNGTKNIAQNYQFIDELIGQQKTATFYYRLKQVDIDGKFNYSKTISIDFSKSESPLILYPNPANDIVHIKNNFQLHNNIKIEVYNIIGKQCLSTTFFVANEEELSLNISNLTSGIYSVIITENLTGKQTVNKFKKD